MGWKWSLGNAIPLQLGAGDQPPPAVKVEPPLTSIDLGGTAPRHEEPQPPPFQPPTIFGLDQGLVIGIGALVAVAAVVGIVALLLVRNGRLARAAEKLAGGTGELGTRRTPVLKLADPTAVARRPRIEPKVEVVLDLGDAATVNPFGRTHVAPLPSERATVAGHRPGRTISPPGGDAVIELDPDGLNELTRRTKDPARRIALQHGANLKTGLRRRPTAAPKPASLVAAVAAPEATVVTSRQPFVVIPRFEGDTRPILLDATSDAHDIEVVREILGRQLRALKPQLAGSSALPLDPDIIDKARNAYRGLTRIAHNLGDQSALEKLLDEFGGIIEKLV